LWKERERRKRKKIIQKERRWVVGKERWEESVGNKFTLRAHLIMGPRAGELPYKKY
jgi:hypothetical protein